MSIEFVDLTQIPVYSEDVYAPGFLEAIERFRQQIRAADALLWATPEYNSSVQGVLKNAIDWASRPLEHRKRGNNEQSRAPMSVVHVIGLSGGGGC